MRAFTILVAGNPPYSGYSTNAGKFLFINPHSLVEEGLLTGEEAASAKYGGEPYRVDYAFARENVTRVLRIAFGRINSDIRQKIDAFAEEESYWLDDYALFMALAARYGGDWTKWESGLAFRDSGALAAGRKELADALAYYGFEPYEFYRQGDAL